MTKNVSPTKPGLAGYGFGYGLALGALSGIAAFVLFGTPKGKKMREEISDIYQDLLNGKIRPQLQEALHDQVPKEPPVEIKPVQHLHPNLPLTNLEQAKTMLEMLSEKVQSLSASAPTPSLKTSSIPKRQFKKLRDS